MKKTNSITIQISFYLVIFLTAAAQSQIKKIDGVNSDLKPTLSGDFQSESLNVLDESYKEEFSVGQQAQDAEKKAAKSKADYETKKFEIEKEISLQRQRMLELKQKKEDVHSQVDSMETELKHLSEKQKETEKELEDSGKKAEEILSMADEKRAQLKASREKLNGELEQMSLLKERTQKSFFKARVETKRLESEIAILEADTQALDTELRNSQIDEIKARNEWISVRTAAEKNRAEKLAIQDTLVTAKNKLASAIKDLKKAQIELAETEKDKNKTDLDVSAEVKRLDNMTANAVKSKSLVEMEKMKTESEIEKLKIYGDTVKKNNHESLEAMRNSQYELMESRLSLESLRSTIIKDAATGEKIKSQNQKSAIQQRSLASEPNDKSNVQGKQWSTSTACRLYARANSKSKVLGQLASGQKLVASPYYGKWLKVFSDGQIGYVEDSCGGFDK